LTFNKSQDALFVQGQSRLLSRIITNLVANAVRYTISGGVIVSLRRDESATRIVLTVADSGIGIAPEVLPHIFEPFFRSPRAQNLIQRGSGLGLDIVKRILVLHSGTIEVTSEINKGSMFYISLPAYQEPAED
jgi:two-component system sensor histidine kinase BaeS